MNDSDFDARAETWDDAGKIARAEAVAKAIRRAVPLSAAMRMLEYGAGTGLLSFALHGAVGPITLADVSAGMRAVARRKISAAKATDMHVVDLDLVRDPLPAERYDLIVSMLTLHHVSDVPRVLAAFYALLDAGGWLCIADLDAEDGSFHGPGADVHHGFERGALQNALADAGFAEITVGDCGAIEREDRHRHYSIFLACGRRPWACENSLHFRL